nr:hypothetical protein CFP56_53231 [Quercus suber]
MLCLEPLLSPSCLLRRFAWTISLVLGRVLHHVKNPVSRLELHAGTIHVRDTINVSSDRAVHVVVRWQSVVDEPTLVGMEGKRRSNEKTKG